MVAPMVALIDVDFWLCLMVASMVGLAWVWTDALMVWFDGGFDHHRC